MTITSEIAFLARALKSPRILQQAEPLAARARDEGWDHETYLAAVVAEEVSARETHGGEHRLNSVSSRRGALLSESGSRA